MRMLMLAAMLCTAPVAFAQDAPHDFRQDTPPVPGQIVETPRDKLRLGRAPLKFYRSDMLGLPRSGPKGLLRQSCNEPRYAPPTDR